ncbi:DUF2259 domain-containing protein [Hoeflea ulvae]|uniref:DUF2259 domain-containing protein n=1 Tax=Hoeflea ulvae TaxID=2983764 RepID=A0ABT3YI01_9HYPH|nr:DUF2259 domain-containing protein [Hoeflea ulvae]MCY0095370.1 DUF2259 domain-containing protein [Hoeflea ulvae]
MPALRHLLFAVIALSFEAGAATAGEFAEFRPIGFSQDGKVFAFEEFGIQDGSGFAFANRFFIDTTDDSFLPSSTVRIVIKDDPGSIGDARARAAAQSATLEARYRFADTPGTFAAFNPLSNLDGAAHLLRYTAFSMVPQPFAPYAVTLQEKPLPPSALCEAFSDRSVGFRLELAEINGEPASLVLHDDKSVPQSRGCPTGYRIGGALTHLADGVSTHVVLVLVRSLGFEGENGRWIAVTRRLE